MFRQSGLHNLSVDVTNDVSRVQASLIVVVQHPIINIHSTAPPVLHGDPTVITIRIQGGREFKVVVAYDDGEFDLVSSESSVQNITTLVEPGNHTMVPVYQLTLSHIYADLGDFLVAINVSNHVSWKEEKLSVHVEEKIGGIVMSTNAKSIVNLSDNQIFWVTVATGNNLVFKWELSEGYIVKTER